MTSQATALEVGDSFGSSFDGATELLRLAELSDLRAVVALWHECGLVIAGHDPADDFKVSLRESETLVLVAVTAANEVIGTGMAEQHDGRGHLWYVAVAPLHRVEGIGRLLVEGCEEWLGEKGVQRVHLSLQSDEAGVINFYRRMGYELSRPRHMRKCLA